MQDDIETIPSVLEAKIGGKRNEQVDILINPTAVESYGINLESLINIVRENNKMVSAGGQDTGDGSFDIKVPGLYETIEDINVFASGKDGIFTSGTPIGITNIDGTVDLFIDPNQLSFVTVNLNVQYKGKL